MEEIVLKLRTKCSMRKDITWFTLRVVILSYDVQKNLRNMELGVELYHLIENNYV